MEKVFNYKEANSFFTTYPLTKGFFFFFFLLWKEGIPGNFERGFLRKN